jgi:hypothetical protein
MTLNKRVHSTNGILLNVEVFNRDDIQFAPGYPCTISGIKSGINTLAAPGDVLLQVNEINVSRTQAKAVQKLIKFVYFILKIKITKYFFINRNLPLPITLQLYRRSVTSTSIKIDKIILNSVDQHQPLNCNIFPSDDRLCLKKDQSLLMSPIASDGSESGVGSESNPYSDGEQRLICESYENEVLRLIEIEKEFIRQLELGVQLYSRPLKHYLISSTEHGKLFQNIEKILAISRYQLNRLQSLSERTIVCYIGKIFHEKLQLICEAFTRYLSGYTNACLQLKQLIKCASFQRFIQGNQTNFSIEQFLQIPINHIENLANQLDILCCTCENANDANYLLHVLKELRQCLLNNESSNYCTTTMTLNSASEVTNHSEDEQILDLQNRLQFANNIQSVTLTGRNRHVIFSGVLLLHNENKSYIEVKNLNLKNIQLILKFVF